MQNIKDKIYLKNSTITRFKLNTILMRNHLLSRIYNVTFNDFRLFINPSLHRKVYHTFPRNPVNGTSFGWWSLDDPNIGYFRTDLSVTWFCTCHELMVSSYSCGIHGPWLINDQWHSAKNELERDKIFKHFDLSLRQARDPIHEKY